MSDRVDRYCLSCGNVTVADAGYYAGSSFYHCETCGRRGVSDIFPKATVFHKITKSHEVLADNLVYYLPEIDKYTSEIIADFYKERAEAIAATVARLKEVWEDD